MEKEPIDGLYKNKQFSIDSIENHLKLTIVSEKDKLLLAKQILVWLGFFHILNLIALYIKPEIFKNLSYTTTLAFTNFLTGITVYYFSKK